MVLDIVCLKFKPKDFRELFPGLVSIAKDCPHIEELDLFSCQVIHFDVFYDDLKEMGRLWHKMKRANIARSNVNPVKFINCLETLEELTVDARYKDDALFQFLLRNVNSVRNTKVQIIFI